ncbi:hypothetical protein TNIN_247651 [Trichonephila inaurata madagascariensis]|uniref:Uncharacterized protein n=1 Tax=Trichonephila inaurata madagascariensis TaxID=2747483 RepID=A0A8X6Y3Y1_9ARAC|nr:hypothetical protein TNIN_247651 [Trichonephila inaurata madagascariensis]
MSDSLVNQQHNKKETHTQLIISHCITNTSDNHSFKCYFRNGRAPTELRNDACLYRLLGKPPNSLLRINECGFVANFRLNPQIYERVVGFDSSSGTLFSVTRCVETPMKHSPPFSVLLRIHRLPIKYYLTAYLKSIEAWRLEEHLFPWQHFLIDAFVSVRGTTYSVVCWDGGGMYKHRELKQLYKDEGGLFRKILCVFEKLFGAVLQ